LLPLGELVESGRYPSDELDRTRSTEVEPAGDEGRESVAAEGDAETRTENLPGKELAVPIVIELGDALPLLLWLVPLLSTRPRSACRRERGEEISSTLISSPRLPRPELGAADDATVSMLGCRLWSVL
jgi:hypothetical protein